MLRFFRYLLALGSVFLFAIGKQYAFLNVQLVGILLFWIVNILYSFDCIRKRIYFLMFNLTFFGFLIARPAISLFIGREWYNFDIESVNFALNSIMISLVFMLLGYFICDKKISKNEEKFDVYNIFKKRPVEEGYFEKFERSSFVFNLRIVSLILFFIGILFFSIAELEKLLFMRSKNYVEYYVSFETKLPYLVTVIASMSKYFLCLFLSTLPPKRLAVFPLFIYVIAAVPSLLIGIRNPIVLNLIFVFLYYFTRDSVNHFSNLKNKEKWLTRVEWTIIILSAPMCLIFLGLYNYIRQGYETESMSLFGIILDLFYKQGVSFDVLCIGHGSIDKIENTGFTNYTFGGIIDYFTHGKLAQVLWGAKSLGNGNNLDMALYSNSFSHRMSYVSRGDEYLQGHGWGSSYILETYADFGYLGVVVFNIFLGMLFAYMFRLMNKGSLRFSIALAILMGIYFCPRDSALGWLNFLFYIQFLAAITFGVFASDMLIKEYSRRNYILENVKK